MSTAATVMSKAAFLSLEWASKSDRWVLLFPAVPHIDITNLFKLVILQLKCKMQHLSKDLSCWHRLRCFCGLTVGTKTGESGENSSWWLQVITYANDRDQTCAAFVHWRQVGALINGLACCKNLRLFLPTHCSGKGDMLLLYFLSECLTYTHWILVCLISISFRCVDIVSVDVLCIWLSSQSYLSLDIYWHWFRHITS